MALKGTKFLMVLGKEFEQIGLDMVCTKDVAELVIKLGEVRYYLFNSKLSPIYLKKNDGFSNFFLILWDFKRISNAPSVNNQNY